MDLSVGMVGWMEEGTMRGTILRKIRRGVQEECPLDAARNVPVNILKASTEIVTTSVHSAEERVAELRYAEDGGNNINRGNF